MKDFEPHQKNKPAAMSFHCQERIRSFANWMEEGQIRQRLQDEKEKKEWEDWNKRKNCTNNEKLK